MSRASDQPPGGISRRGFLKGAGITVAAGSVLGTQPAAAQPGAADPTVLEAGKTHPVTFHLNGRKTTTEVRTGHTLLETLRDRLDRTGTKLVCDMGTCGACTVLLDGQPVNSCLTLAVEAAGRRVETIEGLAEDGRLHPVQQAFIEEDALQCGFCTSGMVMSCKALVDRNPSPTREEVSEAISGNLCRCGTYANVFRAMERVAKGEVK